MRKKTVKKMLSIVLTAAMVGTTYIPVAAEGTQETQVTTAEDGSNQSTDQNKETVNETPAADATTGNEDTSKSSEATTNAGTSKATVEVQNEATSSGVATIEGKEYASLQEAVNAAEENVTVTLQMDVTEDVTIPKGKNITLDLNGKTLTNTNAGKATLSVAGTVYVKNGSIIGGSSYYNIEVCTENEAVGTATLESVTATAGNTGSSMIDNWGTLTIESGTYTGGLNVVKSEPGASLIINDGSFELNYAVGWSYTGVVMNYGTAVINNGTFKQNATSPAKACPTVVITAKDKADDPEPHTTIIGGKYVNVHSNINAKIFHGMSKATSSNFTVTGGTFSKKVPDTYFPDENMCAYNGTEYVIVRTAAMVGTAKYTDLATAFSKARGTKTVKLMSDVDISKNTKAITILSGRNTTLDLNGHEIKAANTSTGNIQVSGKLTLTDSTDTNKDGTGTGKIYTETKVGTGKVVIAVNAGATFTMNSGLVDASSFTSDPKNEGQFAVGMPDTTAKDTEVIINGGKISAGWYAVAGIGTATAANYNITVNGGILESTADYAIYHPQAGTTTINGGVVSGQAGGVCINRGTLKVNGGTVTSSGLGSTGSWGDGTGGLGNAAIYVNAKYGDTKATITGGKITANNDAVIVANGTKNKATVAISGGTFNKAVNEKYCATGYKPQENDDGTYGVTTKESMSASTSVSGSTSTSTIGGKYSGNENGEDKVTVEAGTVTVNVKNEAATEVKISEITVDKNSIASLKENTTVKNVIIQADAGTLNINKAALDKMAENAGNADVILRVEKDQKENDLYYHITAKADGKEIYAENNSAGEVTITVAYSSLVDGFAPTVYYVKDDGTKEKVESTYKSGTLTWKTKHFSTYQVEDAAVAKIGDNYYATLNDAIANVNTDQTTITLLKDISIEAMVTINNGKNIVLDLAGNKITSSLVTTFKITNGTLDVKDSADIKGSIEVTGEAFRLAGYNNATDWANNTRNSVLTIGEGVNVKSSTDCCVYLYGKGAKVDVYGSLESTGAYSTIQGQGTINTTTNNSGTEITIHKGASVVHPTASAIYHPEVGTLTVKGGMISGGTTGIEMRRGTLNVSGGTIISTAKEFSCETNKLPTSGATSCGMAVAIAPHGAVGELGKEIKVSITGGTFEGIYGLYQEDPDNRMNQGVGIDMGITGGTFTSTSQVEIEGVQYGEGIFSGQCEGFVSGQAVSSTSINPEYCKVGYTPVKNSESLYGVDKFTITSNDSSENVPATIVEGEDTNEMYVKVDASMYSTKKYPATLKTYTGNIPKMDPTTGDISYESGECGYIFAGWYKNEDGKYEPYRGTFPESTAYAKFVDANVLTVKTQISSNTFTDSTETTDMRVLTTVDGVKYSSVGFDIEIDGRTWNIDSNTVYSNITGTNGEKLVKFGPELFSEKSKYFMTCRINGIKSENYSVKNKITPYWVTLDGTKVTGKVYEKSVNDFK